MDVTPQLLHDVEFREAKRGGYNTQDVDDFLERLAVGLERQEAQVREALQRLEAADARVADAERRAAQAEQRASEGSDADDTLRRTLVLAQRTADAAIREAEEEAARTLSSAQEEADRLLTEAREASVRARAEAEDEARRAHEDARARVLAEMRELEGTRDDLRHDVDLLEHHLDEQRERLRQAAETLQQLLEDPSALAPVEPPALSGAAPPVEARRPDPVAPRPPLVAPPADELEAHERVDAGPAGWVPDEEAWEAPEEEAASTSLFARPPAEPEGPTTQPVDHVVDDRPDDDDAYLAELRKAMTDESPLGPREDRDEPYDDDHEPTRSRFGRRR